MLEGERKGLLKAREKVAACNERTKERTKERRQLHNCISYTCTCTYLRFDFFRRATVHVDLAVDLSYHRQAVSSGRCGWRCLQRHA